MSGTKRVYDIDSSEYYKFFGIEQKFSISVRSLTSHYKRICGILSKEGDVIKNNKLSFAKTGFETLLNPISRAKYILKLKGFDDFNDTNPTTDISIASQLKLQLKNSNDIESINLLIGELKEQSDFIIEQIRKNIDVKQNYRVASSFVTRWYELQKIYKLAKEKRKLIGVNAKLIPIET